MIKLLFTVAILAGKIWAQSPTQELAQNKKFLNQGTDRLGGMTAAERHSIFSPSKVKAQRLGQAYRRARASGSSADVCDNEDVACDVTDSYRTADGSCNNVRHPHWGKSVIPMRRYLQPAYQDGESTPRTRGRNGNLLTSARLISTTLHTEHANSSKSDVITHMTMQFGQFLDHDITLTAEERGTLGATITCCPDNNRRVCFPITVPANDRHFASTCMNFVRSLQTANADCNLTPAEQVNQLTAYIDGSNVYGSDHEEQEELRSHTGGQLKVSANNMLPENHEDDCVTATTPNYCFLAGDERVNEQMGLASMHTLWMREHNRIAENLANINPDWDDERLFQETRKIVGAMLQHVVYTEFLPVVLAPTYLKQYNLLPGKTGKYSNVYKTNVDASIRNSFATAAFRYGHSLIRDLFSHRNNNYWRTSDIELVESFGNTSILIASDGDAVDTLTRGLITDAAHEVDRHVTRHISDLLFQDDDGGSFDLIALNIQRGRDHGLPGYNAWRKWCGLSRASNFKAGKRGGLVDHDSGAAKALQQLYRSPDDIDLFSGGLSETAVAGGEVGPTFSCILGKQFQALKTGDRFWYETGDKTVRFTPGQLSEIRKASLSRVICDNTDTTKAQPLAFKQASNTNKKVACSKLPSVDLKQWKDWDSTMWGGWGKWSACKNGKSTRTRRCNAKSCKGSKVENKKCGNNCAWSSWGKWGQCVKGCQFQVRTCPCNTCKKSTKTTLNWRRCNTSGKEANSCQKLYKSIGKRYFQ